jgi:hypothetical protein
MAIAYDNLRETKGLAGRVYQLRPGDPSVAIDWIPIVPVAQFDVFLRGEAVFHPTEGKVVYFPGARRRRGVTKIAVRTGARPDLLELFNLAVMMKTELRSEISTDRPRSHGRRP